MKPVACGGISTPEGLRNEDALLLMRHATNDAAYELVNPYFFAQPVAPHIAATAQAKSISIPVLKQVFDKLAKSIDFVVVEGVGGWMVPLNERETTADLAALLGLPVILVVGMRLGCLSHALLSCESIISKGLPLAGWVANTLDPAMPELEKNIAALQKRIAAPLLGVVPYLPDFSADTIGAALDVQVLLKTY